MPFAAVLVYFSFVARSDKSPKCRKEQRPGALFVWKIVEIQNESGWFANFALGKWLMYAAARWLAMSSTNLKSPSSQIAIRPISKAKLPASACNIFQYLLVFKEREANASKKEDATLQASASNLVECLCMFELWELLWESSQDVLLERLANGKDAPDTESNWLWCGQGAAVNKFRKRV